MERTALKMEKYRFFTLKAVLFHPQNGAFPKLLLYGVFYESEFSLHSTIPIKLLR